MPNTAGLLAHTRRAALGALAACALAAAPQAWAQAAWPGKPVTIVVPAAAGGTTDMAARLLAQDMGQQLGQSVVVDNRAGGGGIIGTQAVLAAKPDGYTLLMGNIGPNAINYSMYKKLPYKAADLVPITNVISVPNVLVVHADSPFKTAAELIAYAKANPDKINMGSTGTGQSPHMSAEMFMQRAGFKAPHAPYKGAGPAVQGLLGKQFDFMIDNLPSSLPQIQAGKFRALAVTSAKRNPALPNVPTMAEAGVPDMVVTAWFGLFAPAGTPQAVIDKVHAAAVHAMKQPEVRKRLTEQMGGEVGGEPQAEYKAFVAGEIQRWGQVVRAAGISAD
jgi:tripartite-type tricarboxylate transporter receptor subunit TctC